MTDETRLPRATPPRPSRWRPRRGTLLAATASVLVLAGMAGAVATGFAQTPPPVGAAPRAAGPQTTPQAAAPQAVMILTPVAIGKMQDNTLVAVKGSVAEIFGNKFILQDDSGRALVDLGPAGDDRAVVAKGEQVMVQGMFDRGFIKAQVLSHADGRNEAFGPPRPPGPDRRPPPPDRRAQRGPDRGPPPPPPGMAPPPMGGDVAPSPPPR